MGGVEPRLSMFGEWIGGEKAESETIAYISYQSGCGRRVYCLVKDGEG